MIRACPQFIKAGVVYRVIKMMPELEKIMLNTERVPDANMSNFFS